MLKDILEKNGLKESHLADRYIKKRKELDDIIAEWLLLNVEDILIDIHKILDVLDSGTPYGFKGLGIGHNINVHHINVNERYEQIWIDYFQSTDAYADYTFHIVISPKMMSVSVYVGDDSPITDDALINLLSRYYSNFEIKKVR